MVFKTIVEKWIKLYLPGAATVFLITIAKIVAVAYVVHGVYKLKVIQSVMTASAGSRSIGQLRLGHVNSNYFNKMPSAVESMNLWQ